MAGTIHKTKKPEAPGLAGEMRGEAERLGAEVERYRSVFDSARMIVGHEFIRPLTSISGYVELLESRLGEAVGESEQRYFSRIRSAVSQIGELVETFLQMLSSEAGPGRAGEWERVCIRESVERLRPRYDADRARLHNAVGPDLPRVLTRRKHLEIVLDNLISNALKYGGESDPVTVTAETMRDRRTPGSEDLVMVTVEDRGPGIDPGEMERIFDPFYRGGDDEGLGLGLALVRNVTTLLGGQISVRSEPGDGTAVTFTLPLDGPPSREAPESREDREAR